MAVKGPQFQQRDALIQFYRDKGYNQAAGYLQSVLGSIKNAEELEFYVTYLDALKATSNGFVKPVDIDDQDLAAKVEQQVMQIRQLCEAKAILTRRASEQFDQDRDNAALDAFKAKMKQKMDDDAFELSGAAICGFDDAQAKLDKIQKGAKKFFKKQNLNFPPLRSDNRASSNVKSAVESNWKNTYVENPLMAMFTGMMSLVKPLMDGSYQHSKDIQGEVAMQAPKILAGVLGGFFGMFMPKRVRSQMAEVMDPIMNDRLPFAKGQELDFDALLSTGASLLNAFTSSKSAKGSKATSKSSFFEPFVDKKKAGVKK